jgi:hypothetical protein
MMQARPGHYWMTCEQLAYDASALRRESMRLPPLGAAEAPNPALLRRLALTPRVPTRACGPKSTATIIDQSGGRYQLILRNQESFSSTYPDGLLPFA